MAAAMFAGVWIRSYDEHAGEAGLSFPWDGIGNPGEAYANIDGFRKMGPKGIKILVRTLMESSHPVRPWLVDRLPWGLADKLSGLSGRHREEARWNRLAYTATIMRALGSNAAPAVPGIIKLLKDPEIDPGAVETCVDILGAIGPKANAAIPVLRELSTNSSSAALPAAMALWEIDHETNVVIEVLSNHFQGGMDRRMVLPYFESLGPALKPIVPLLVNALTNDSLLRDQAEALLRKLDPEKLDKIIDDINAHQDDYLERSIEALTNGNLTLRLRGMAVLRVFGPGASDAADLLADRLNVAQKQIEKGGVNFNEFSERRACLDALAELGLGASNAAPIVIRVLNTSVIEFQYAVQDSVFRVLDGMGTNAGDTAPRLTELLTNTTMSEHWSNTGMARATAALIRVAPSNQAAKTALLQLSTNSSEPVSMTAKVALWRMGLETNPPMGELIAAAKQRYRGMAQDAIELLGEIGPAASNALPVLATYLNLTNGYYYRAEAAIAIRKIDPAEARRLKLPGLLIVCPNN